MKKICYNLIDLILNYKWIRINLLGYTQNPENRKNYTRNTSRERKTKDRKCFGISQNIQRSKHYNHYKMKELLSTSKSTSIYYEQDSSNLDNQNKQLTTSQSYEQFNFIVEGDSSIPNKQLLQIDDNHQIQQIITKYNKNLKIFQKRYY